MSGSFFSFYSELIDVHSLCRKYTKAFQSHLEEQPRFIALGKAVRAKGLHFITDPDNKLTVYVGLPLIALIRFCRVLFSLARHCPGTELTSHRSFPLPLLQPFLRYHRKRVFASILVGDSSHHAKAATTFVFVMFSHIFV